MTDPKSSSKEKRGGLRLVRNATCEEAKGGEATEAPKARVYKSRFAAQLAAFADNLDHEIDEIMKL